MEIDHYCACESGGGIVDPHNQPNFPCGINGVTDLDKNPKRIECLNHADCSSTGCILNISGNCKSCGCS